MAEWLLRWWLPRGVVGDSIVGDSREEFCEYRREHGALAGAMWYWAHVLRIAGHYTLGDSARENGEPAGLSPSQRTHALIQEIKHAAKRGRELEMGSLLKDLKFGARALSRKPGSALISVVVLAMGIGLSAFMFSLIHGIFFRGLGVSDEHELVVVRRTDLTQPQAATGLAVSLQDYSDMVERQTSFEALAAYRGGTVNLSGTEGPERYQGAFITADLFDVLQVRPILGREFTPDEDDVGAAWTVVLGYQVWQDRYNGDPGVLGKAVIANGEAATIIGVMEEGFLFPSNHEIWLAMRDDPLDDPRGEGVFVSVIGRLNDGVSEDHAALEFAGIAQQLSQEYPESNEGIGTMLMDFVVSQNGPQITTVFASMMVAVLLVLMVACANVANLLLARATMRTKEAAIRTAMGGRTLRVVLPFFAEAVVLSVAGALVGIVIAYIAVAQFDAATAGSLTGRPYFMVFEVNLVVIAFVVGLAVLTSLLAGAAPAFLVARSDVNEVLKDESRGSSSFSLGKLSKILVVGEVALSCALLVGAGLMTKSMINLGQKEYPYDTGAYFTARVGLFETDYPDAQARQTFFDELNERVAALPSVQASAIMNVLPAVGSGRPRIQLDGEVYEDVASQPQEHWQWVSAGYFDALGVRLLQGEDFRPEHDRDAPPVAIVNQSFVDRYYGGDSPLGQRFRVGTSDTIAWTTIIGVAPDLDMQGLIPAGQPGADPSGFYLPVRQRDASFLTIMAKAVNGTGMSVTADIRQVVRSIDPQLPIYNVRSLEEALRRSSWFYSVFGTVFIVFGVAALFMASVGLYGVLSFSVSRRIQEMGIRMALGAGAKDVVRLVVRDGAVQLGVGLALGAALAYGVSRVVALLMFQVNPQDPMVFGIVLSVIALVGMLATWIPARRATKVDPMVALRYE